MAQTPETTSLGLNKWGPEDDIRTAQFTEDNRIIDAAFPGSIVVPILPISGSAISGGFIKFNKIVFVQLTISNAGDISSNASGAFTTIATGFPAPTGAANLSCKRVVNTITLALGVATVASSGALTVGIPGGSTGFGIYVQGIYFTNQ